MVAECKNKNAMADFDGSQRLLMLRAMMILQISQVHGSCRSHIRVQEGNTISGCLITVIMMLITNGLEWLLVAHSVDNGK